MGEELKRTSFVKVHLKFDSIIDSYYVFWRNWSTGFGITFAIIPHNNNADILYIWLAAVAGVVKDKRHDTIMGLLTHFVCWRKC